MMRATIVAALALAGCYEARIVMSPVSATPPRAAPEQPRHISALGVLEISDPEDLANVCPRDMTPLVIREEVGFLSGLVGMLAGFYVPLVDVRDVAYVCGIDPTLVGGR